MLTYEKYLMEDFNKWKREMKKKPGIVEKASKGMQNKINGLWPAKYHELLTSAIKNMTKAVLLGSQFTTQEPEVGLSLEERDRLAKKFGSEYKKIAMIEGAGTGAGGIMLGLVDFPLLLGIKMKLLYEIAAIYGFNTKHYTERIYILSIFELAFSSQAHTNEVFKRFEDWTNYKQTLSKDMQQFDWKTFQQEYRDYLDLAKLMQLVPVIGAPVGAYVNNKLVDKLCNTAMQAYRMRWINHC